MSVEDWKCSLGIRREVTAFPTSGPGQTKVETQGLKIKAEKAAVSLQSTPPSFQLRSTLGEYFGLPTLACCGYDRNALKLQDLELTTELAHSEDFIGRTFTQCPGQPQELN